MISTYNAATDHQFAESEPDSDKIILETLFSMNKHDSINEFSIWSIVDYKTEGAPYIKFVRKTLLNELIEEVYLHSARAIDIQHGMLKLSHEYKQLLKEEKITVSILKGKHHQFERLMIRPKNIDIYQQIGSTKLFNNYLLE